MLIQKMKKCKFFKAYQGLYTPRCGCDTCWIKFVDTRVAILKAKLDIKTNKLYESCVELRERREAEATMYRRPQPPTCTNDNHIVVYSSFGAYCQRCGETVEDSK